MCKQVNNIFHYKRAIKLFLNEGQQDKIDSWTRDENVRPRKNEGVDATARVIYHPVSMKFIFSLFFIFIFGMIPCYFIFFKKEPPVDKCKLFGSTFQTISATLMKVRSFHKLTTLDLRSTELWKRVQICISFQCRSDLGTMKKLEIAREWFPVIRRRPTINSWD